MIQWRKIANDLGHPDEKNMWVILYNRFSVEQLALRFAVSPGTIRAQLRLHDIPSKPRGGANNQKILIDDFLLGEVKARGVPTVAKEQGLDVTTLYKAMRKAGYDGQCNVIPKWKGQKPYKRPVRGTVEANPTLQHEEPHALPAEEPPKAPYKPPSGDLE